MNDKVLADVRAASSRLSELAAADCSDVECFHDVVAAMHCVCSRIVAAERAGFEPTAIRAASMVAREVHARSPFVRRLQTWPRGYPGDFETIEYLLAQRVRAPHATVEFWVEYYALSTLIAQQHRNKVAAQAAEVARALSVAGRQTRVLVIAAGSSPDLALVEDQLRDRECEVVLNDGDEAALAFSLTRLAAIGHRLRAVHGNAVTSATKLAPFGPFDLILAGGLFDYLSDRHAAFLAEAVWERLLAPGGRFFFTNLGRQNPYRVWMEYMADWRLIERSEADLLWLVSSACGPAAVCSIVPEGTGLSWLVSVDRLR